MQPNSLRLSTSFRVYAREDDKTSNYRARDGAGFRGERNLQGSPHLGLLLPPDQGAEFGRDEQRYGSNTASTAERERLMKTFRKMHSIAEGRGASCPAHFGFCKPCCQWPEKYTEGKQFHGIHFPRNGEKRHTEKRLMLFNTFLFSLEFEFHPSSLSTLVFLLAHPVSFRGGGER